MVLLCARRMQGPLTESAHPESRACRSCGALLHTSTSAGFVFFMCKMGHSLVMTWPGPADGGRTMSGVSQRDVQARMVCMRVWEECWALSGAQQIYYSCFKRKGKIVCAWLLCGLGEEPHPDPLPAHPPPALT